MCSMDTRSKTDEPVHPIALVQQCVRIIPRTLAPYLLAGGSVLAAVLGSQVLSALVDPTAGVFMLLTATVAINAWYGGRMAGLLAVVLAVAATVWWLAPSISRPDGVRLAGATTLFVVVGIGISLLAEWLRPGGREAEGADAKASSVVPAEPGNVEPASRPGQPQLEVVANISHELRTPMNAIVGMTELALREDLAPAVRDYLQTAKESADVLLRLLNDILDFSKINAGGFALESSLFSLRTVLDETVKSLGPQAYGKGLELACHIPQTVPDDLVGDPVRLRQVFTNLITNAIKFTERGEVVVRAAMAAYTADEVCLQFSVSDTGIGISPQDQGRIFAPFTQVDSSTTRMFGGTGLGLAIVSELVSMMGGRLWLESELGRGSTFHFTARFPQLLDRPPPVREREIPLDMLRDVPVLVACDNGTNRRILEESLSTWLMKPRSAADPASALAELRSAAEAGHPYALVMLDAMFCGGEGFTLAQNLTENPRLAKAVVLITSPAERRNIGSRCHGLRIAAHLDKPVLHSGLLEAVLTALHAASESNGFAADRDFLGVTRQPLDVLLAEDMRANQEVVKSILQKRGHRVEVVADGRAAVGRFQERPFDVILMDVQMPGMDGFQATQQIRGLERSSHDHVPIVAMTAHALAGDRDRCLSAGMDGYLAKPVHAQEVIEVVERYSQGDSASPCDQRPLSEPPESPPAATQSAFQPEAALARLEGSRSLLRDLMEFFVTDWPGLFDQVRSGVEGGDLRRVQQAAHSLKGLAANFEAQKAVEAARRIESSARQQDPVSVAAGASTLEDEFRRLEAALREYFDASRN